MYDHTRQNFHICELNKFQSDFWSSSIRLSTSRQHKTESAEDGEHFQRWGPNKPEKISSGTRVEINKPNICRSHGRAINNAFFCIKKSTPSTRTDDLECPSSTKCRDTYLKEGGDVICERKTVQPLVAASILRISSQLHQKPESAYEQGSSGMPVFKQCRKIFLRTVDAT